MVGMHEETLVRMAALTPRGRAGGGAAGERAGVEATTHRPNKRNRNADRPNKRNRNADRPNDVLSSKGENADSPREWILETVPSKRKCG